ncbi:CotH kinase family protein, partial [bacterium]|nr:CotH kinase family protein [bacterium]
PYALQKWRVVRARMEPGEFTLVWADDSTAFDHSNFKLDQKGEFLALVSPDGDIIDSVFFPNQIADVSYGRSPDAGPVWRYFQTPTPNTANPETGDLQPVQLTKPDASNPSGFYDRRARVTLSVSPGIEIHYTLDGSVPTLDSPVYQRALNIIHTSVLRARAFAEGRIPSEVLTQTYFIDEETTLPIVSIAFEPDHFFDDKIGIYVEGTNGVTGNCADEPRNWNRDWERPVNVEFFETDGSLGFELGAGVKIYGGCSRQRDRRSLALFMRDKYGMGELDYPLFPDDKPIHSFQSFVLRNSGNDAEHTLIRDGYMQGLVKGQMDVDSQAFRPAIVFLNGEYWGLYNIREKINEHYPETNYGVPADQVDLLYNNQSVFSGEKDHYEALRSFVIRNDMNDPEAYQWVKSQMDVNEYINYQIAQIYFSNTDWPGNNIKYWRPRTPTGRWRWILFDTDFGFNLQDNGLSHNTLAFALDPNETEWPNPAWSTLLFRELMESEAFRDEFIQRFAVYLSTAFEPDRVMDLLSVYQDQIAAEMPRHIERWDEPSSINSWNNKIAEMRSFGRIRPRVLYRYIKNQFKLSDFITINLNAEGGGRIYAAGAPLFASESETSVYPEVPLQLRAVAFNGNRFIGWQGIDAATDVATILPQPEQTVTAVFEPGPAVVINEIHYHPFAGEGNQDYEFIELFNAGTTSVDLTGYQLSGGVHFDFQNETTLSVGGYLVLAKDAAKYQGLDCDVISWGDDRLANEGERIELTGPMGEVIDAVDYNATPEWPANTDGSGFSLSLIDVNTDRDEPQNWAASAERGGTPGRLNFKTPPTMIQNWKSF